MASDYRDSTLTAEKRETPTDRAHRWWDVEGKQRADAVSSNLNALYQRQGLRLAQLVMSARLYGNLSLLGIQGMTYGRVAAVHPSVKDRISYNLVQSCVDAITSKIAKNKPKPDFVTNGGNYKLVRRAKNLNKFCAGIFYENKAYALGPRLFKDATVWGDGVLHVFADGRNRVRWERVISSELYVDELEAIYGNPRSMHRVKNIDRDVLLAIPEFAKRRDLITTAVRSPDAEAGNSRLSDMVAVRQSWHLPSGEGKGDGVVSISIAEGELWSGKWKHDFFPFARLPWSERLYGYWGQGLAEQLQPLQLEINKLLWVIQRSHHLAGSFKVFLHTTSKVVSEHLNNDIGGIVRWSGNNRPEYVTPPAVQAEIYQHLGTLIQRGFEQSGISQLSAASQKPAGLNSGKALREYNDIESDRFMTVGQQYEAFFLEAARLSIATVQDIVEEEGSYKVRVPGAKSLEVIDWKNVRLEEDEYVMQCYPVSELADEPAQRLQDLQEFAQAGLIDQDEIRPLMNFPDLDRSDSLAGAQREVIVRALEAMIEDGEYTPPQSFDNLPLAMKLANQYYATARLQDVPEENQEQLRRYMKQVQALMQAAQPPAPPPGPGAPGAAPQGAPAAPPVSQLLPNAPAA